jgi:starvation-inducible outer membrane lipoprotein
MEKFKYINRPLGAVVLVLAGCATQPNALEEQKKQQEATQKKIDETSKTKSSKRLSRWLNLNLWWIAGRWTNKKKQPVI